MKNNKLKKFASIVAIAAMTTTMFGNATQANTKNINGTYAKNNNATYDANNKTSLYGERKKITFKLKNGEAEIPVFICKVGSKRKIKLCFGNCTDGQAVINIHINDKIKDSYTIPKSDSKWKTYEISAPAGSEISYSIRPDYFNGYLSAEGYFEINLND